MNFKSELIENGGNYHYVVYFPPSLEWEDVLEKQNPNWTELVDEFDYDPDDVDSESLSDFEYKIAAGDELLNKVREIFDEIKNLVPNEKWNSTDTCYPIFSVLACLLVPYIIAYVETEDNECIVQADAEIMRNLVFGS